MHNSTKIEKVSAFVSYRESQEYNDPRILLGGMIVVSSILSSLLINDAMIIWGLSIANISAYILYLIKFIQLKKSDVFLFEFLRFFILLISIAVFSSAVIIHLDKSRATSMLIVFLFWCMLAVINWLLISYRIRINYYAGNRSHKSGMVGTDALVIGVAGLGIFFTTIAKKYIDPIILMEGLLMVIGVLAWHMMESLMLHYYVKRYHLEESIRIL